TWMIPLLPGATGPLGQSRVVQSHPLATSISNGVFPVLINSIWPDLIAGFFTEPRSYSSWLNSITGYSADCSLLSSCDRSLTLRVSRRTGTVVGPSMILNSVRLFNCCSSSEQLTPLVQ